MLRRRVIAAAIPLVLTAAGCSTAESTAAPPTSVASADVVEPVLTPDLRIGVVLNISAPTAERDQQVVEVLMSAIQSSPSAAIANVETLQIDEPNDAADAVVALRGLGVTVLITTCDDGTVPDVVEAGLANDMLVLTGCTAIPQPSIDTTSELVVDVAALATSPGATATAVEEILADVEEPTIATLASDLVPDVIGECSGIEDQLEVATVSVSEQFTELVDDPADLIETQSIALEGVDAIVICALSPTVGEVVSQLRSSGLNQPVLIPWFADDQTWSDGDDDVWIVAPSSRYGDDPVDEVNDLYSQLGAAEATDVVAADTLFALVEALRQAGAVRPEQLAEVLASEPFMAFSGELQLNRTGNVERTYRLIEVVDGVPTFRSTLEN